MTKRTLLFPALWTLLALPGCGETDTNPQPEGTAGAAGSTAGGGSGGGDSGGAAGGGAGGTAGADTGGSAGTGGDGGTNSVSAGVTVTAGELVTTEAGGTATVTLVLDRVPEADVEVDLVTSDDTEGTVDVAKLTFTADTWDAEQTITVTGADDLVADGDKDYTVSLTVSSSDDAYGALVLDDLALTNQDDDVARVSVTPTEGLETHELGGIATFTVALNSQPTEEVTIQLGSSDETEGVVAPSELVFPVAEWDQEQTVTVTGVKEDGSDGRVEYTVNLSGTSDDPVYDGIAIDSVGLVNLDWSVERIATGVLKLLNVVSVSRDGKHVAANGPEYEQGFYPLFVHDLETGAHQTVSMSNLDGTGTPVGGGKAFLSTGGRYVGFNSNQIGGVTTSQAYLTDRYADGNIALMSQSPEGEMGDGVSGSIVASADWRHIAFESKAKNFLATEGTQDIFLRDRDGGIKLASKGNDGFATMPSISADGTLVVFHTKSAGLVDHDTNDTDDVFLYDSVTDTVTRVSESAEGLGGDLMSYKGIISPDGGYVAFISKATNLILGETNERDRVYLKNLSDGSVKRINDATSIAFFTWNAPKVSNNGRFVFYYEKPAKVMGYDTLNDVYKQINVSSAGEPSAHGFSEFGISDDGTVVAINTIGPLVSEDEDTVSDIYVMRLDEAFWAVPDAPAPEEP